MTGAFLLCVTFEVMGFCEGFGAYRYSRRLTPCGRGLRQPPGLMALGCQGSACDRLRRTGRLRAPPSGVMKYRCAGEVGALMGAIFYAAFGGRVNAFLLCATMVAAGFCEGFGGKLRPAGEG